MIWLRVAAALIGAVLLFSQIMGAFRLFQFARAPENQPVAGFALGLPWPTITSAVEDTGLRAGDRLIAVRDRPFAGYGSLFEELEKSFPGDRFRVTVEAPGGARREASWQLGAPERPTWRMIVFLVLLTQFMPLLCIVTGLWTVLMRPREPQAWLLFAMLASFAHMVEPVVPVRGWAATIHSTLQPAWPAAMFVFAWAFPRRTEWMQRFRMPVYGFIGLLLAIVAMEAWRGYLEATQGDSAAAAIGWLHAQRQWLRFVMMGAVSGFFALISYKLSQLRDPDSRRRLGVLRWGATAALTPVFLLILYSLATGTAQGAPPVWITIPSTLALTLFPVTLAYVIVVHKAFGIAVVIRQGLRYALARRGVRVLQAVATAGVMLTAAIMATSPGMNRPRVMMVMAAGAFFVLLLRGIAERISGWVDRKFFREAYNAELLLGGLSEDVRSIVETKPLLETVATKVAAALHVERITMLLQDGDALRPAFALGPAYTSAEIENAELLLPLTAKNKQLGVAALGPKRSEEPYSPSDVRLLRSVAAQTGLALENAQLTAAVTEAVAQRERLNREIEIAQEVQERLFPQHLPAIEGIEYLGFCRPARGVGGDSYDFLKLDNGIFAFSIGDVSGKGVPAALLMASLQSALRGQAMSHPPDLGVMVGTLNRLIYDSSPSNRYATLFYAELNPITGVVKYVNGGHNAPMILRGDQVIRLEACGPVVGLFRPGQYEQGSVQLQSGDLFVGFTDGVSEAMNENDEEWGEEQLAALLPSVANMDLPAISRRILQEADAFANGHPQHDDMTLILLRYLTTATDATVRGPIRS